MNAALSGASFNSLSHTIYTTPLLLPCYMTYGFHILAFPQVKSHLYNVVVLYRL